MKNLNPTCKAMLAQIVSQQGVVDATDRRICKALLSDLCGNTPDSEGSINLLAAAIDFRIPQTLLAKPDVPRAMLVNQLASRIEVGLFINASAARWAVESWDAALSTTAGIETLNINSSGTSSIRQLLAAMAALHERVFARVPFLRRVHTAPADDNIVATAEVSVGPGCDYASLSDALSAAPNGATIRVRGGSHQGPIVIDRPLRIIASEAHGISTLISSSAPCVVIRSAHATFSGFHISIIPGHTGPMLNDRPAIEIEGGRPEVNNCQIDCSKVSTAIRIRGVGSDPLIANVRIQSPRGDGILVCNGATGRIESCEVLNAGRTGITVTTGGDPSVRLTRISASAGIGLLVSDGGLGVYELCDFRNNYAVNVAVTHASSPVLRRCRIAGARTHNVLFDSQSTGTLDRCDVLYGDGTGITIRGRARPALRACKVRLNLGVGIDVGDDSQCRVDNCQFDGNGNPLRVAKSALASIQGGNIDVPSHLQTLTPNGSTPPKGILAAIVVVVSVVALLGACAGAICSHTSATLDRAAPISACVFGAIPLLLLVTPGRAAGPARRTALSCLTAFTLLGAFVGVLLGLSGAGAKEGAIFSAAIVAVIAIVLEGGPLLRGLRPTAIVSTH